MENAVIANQTPLKDAGEQFLASGQVFLPHKGATELNDNIILTPEIKRMQEDFTREKNWKRWGPYLSERQWGTVREDYSDDGNCWDYFPHEHARSRVYRWGEDGLMGITDRQCRLCFGLSLWNGKDEMLKERLYGLTGHQGNHGEDVKECYYYLDSTPTHSYMKGLYKYPQMAFPYQALLKENQKRDKGSREYELEDTGVFRNGRYFDVFAEYAKGGENDILIQITVHNRGPVSAPLSLLPTFWCRNSWVWGCRHEGCERKPAMWLDSQGYMDEAGIELKPGSVSPGSILLDHVSLGKFRMSFDAEASSHQVKPTEVLFTENETNHKRLFGFKTKGKYFRDAFHDYVIDGDLEAVNPKGTGTKAAVLYQLHLDPGASATVRLRMTEVDEGGNYKDGKPAGSRLSFNDEFKLRRAEADEFYDHQMPSGLDDEQKNVMRQTYAGMLWSKQFYHYIVDDWLEGDEWQPTPPESRMHGRNSDWRHLYNRDIISMPDKWEYPWYAAWDLAFHCLPLARVDPNFAKSQLKLFLKEWFMHPNGQIPAYEFNFSDVNPPVHAWACWRVFKMTAPRGYRDRSFLARVYQKLLLNFTWWVNRKDKDGNHIFQGGFLGLDNIGVFDRSQPLPTGGYLQQADGTAWMAFYSGTMLAMSLELAKEDRSYSDMASKFFEHFIAIVDAMNTLGGSGLWDEEDGFYYDRIQMEDGESVPLRVRSVVGLLPLIATEVIDSKVMDSHPNFAKRTNWFLKYRKDLASHISYLETSENKDSMLLSLFNRERLERVLKYMFDENEFLSPYGIRSLSKYHEDAPFELEVEGETYSVNYTPAESSTRMFGGNSNWRGPVWFPINYLLIEALERFHHFYGDSFKMEYPTGSGIYMSLEEIANDLSLRLSKLFTMEKGKRPAHGEDEMYQKDPAAKDLILFYEYFDGDNGRGVGASHQTGWTGLVAQCLERVAKTQR